MNENVATIKNRANCTLYGIIHQPLSEDSVKNKIGVILVHSGVRGRVGTGRQYVFYARELAKLGYLVCRFDAYGMGDSEGRIEDGSSKMYYRSIQFGRYVDDTSLWTKYIKEEYNLNKIILCGLCGGAITSLITGGKNALVDGLILLNPPVMLDDDKVDYLAKRPKEYYRKGLMQYVRKATNPNSIFRFISGKADYHLMVYLLKGIIKGKKTRPAANKKAKHSDAEFNRLFLSSMKKFTSQRKKILFIYGDNDYFKIEFETEILRRYQKTLPQYCEYETIPDANHMLTIPNWQQTALQIFCQWLQRL